MPDDMPSDFTFDIGSADGTADDVLLFGTDELNALLQAFEADIFVDLEEPLGLDLFADSSFAAFG